MDERKNVHILYLTILDFILSEIVVLIKTSPRIYELGHLAWK